MAGQAELVLVRNPELSGPVQMGIPFERRFAVLFRPTLAARPLRVEHPGDLVQDRIGLPFLPGIAKEARKLVGLFRAKIGRDLLLLAGVEAAVRKQPDRDGGKAEGLVGLDVNGGVTLCGFNPRSLELLRAEVHGYGVGGHAFSSLP